DPPQDWLLRPAQRLDAGASAARTAAAHAAVSAGRSRSSHRTAARRTAARRTPGTGSSRAPAAARTHTDRRRARSTASSTAPCRTTRTRRAASSRTRSGTGRSRSGTRSHRGRARNRSRDIRRCTHSRGRIRIRGCNPGRRCTRDSPRRNGGARCRSNTRCSADWNTAGPRRGGRSLPRGSGPGSPLRSRTSWVDLLRLLRRPGYTHRGHSTQTRTSLSSSSTWTRSCPDSSAASTSDILRVEWIRRPSPHGQSTGISSPRALTRDSGMLTVTFFFPVTLSTTRTLNHRGSGLRDAARSADGSSACGRAVGAALCATARFTSARSSSLGFAPWAATIETDRPRTPTNAMLHAVRVMFALRSLEPDLDLLALVSLDVDDLRGSGRLELLPEVVRVVSLEAQLAPGVLGQALEDHVRQPDGQVHH